MKRLKRETMTNKIEPLSKPYHYDYYDMDVLYSHILNKIGEIVEYMTQEQKERMSEDKALFDLIKDGYTARCRLSDHPELYSPTPDKDELEKIGLKIMPKKIKPLDKHWKDYKNSSQGYELYAFANDIINKINEIVEYQQQAEHTPKIDSQDK